MLPSFATQSITRVRASTTEDIYHNDVVDWGLASETLISGCSVQPGATTEDLINRDGVLIQWTVFAPSGTDIEATDRVKYLGATYEIDGEPDRWATGVLDHVRFFLKRWEG